MSPVADPGTNRSSAASTSNERPPRIAAVVKGAPFDPATWSSGSYFLFRALRRAGVLHAAIDAEPPRPVDMALRLAAFRRSRERWRQQYALGRPLRLAGRLTGWARARRSGAEAEALLQIGAWYDFTGLPGLSPRIRASYHDGNLARYLQRPDLTVDRDSRLVRRALAFERRTYDRLDVIFTMSEWLRRSFIEDFGQDPDKVVVAGAGANFESAPQELPDRGGLPPRFLFVGKDFERKGGPELCAAFAIVRERHPEAELILVGPQQAPPPQPGLRFIGRIARSEPGGAERLAELYRDATAFVMPSRYEPFGWVFLEAMSWGLPVVGADTCAMPEIVSDGETGHIAPVGDAEALAERMSDLAGDPARAAAMGRAGRDRFERRFTWDVVAGVIGREIGRRLRSA